MTLYRRLVFLKDLNRHHHTRLCYWWDVVPWGISANVALSHRSSPLPVLLSHLKSSKSYLSLEVSSLLQSLKTTYNVRDGGLQFQQRVKPKVR